METTLPISSLIIICLGGIGVCISLSTGGFILSQKKNRDKSSYLIAALLLICGFTLLNETLTTSGITNRFKSLYFIPLNFSFNVGLHYAAGN